MKGLILVAFKMMALGAGAGCMIMLVDYVYRQLYVTAWRAGWNARNAFNARRNIADMRKRDRKMYMYSVNAGEHDREIVRDVKMQEEETAAAAE